MTKFEEKANKIASELGYNCFRDLIGDDEETDKIMAEFADWELQQALPVVPEDVAKLPPFDDMKEYVLDERLLTIREYLNKLDDKSNSDITEAEAWCLIHEDIAYRAMLEGYTVEKPQLFYLKHIDMSKEHNDVDWYLVNDGELDHDFEYKGLSPKQDRYKFTQQEIASMETGSYEQIKVEGGE